MLKHRISALVAVLFLLSGIWRSALAASGVANLSVQEFQSLAAELSHKVNLFETAWRQNPEAEFFGGTTRDYLYWLKGKFQDAKSHDDALEIAARLRAEPSIDVRSFIIGDSDVDITSPNALNLSASQYGLKKIDYIPSDRFDLSTDLGKTELKQGYIPVEKIRLGKSGFVSWQGFGDGLKEIYDGHPTVHFPDPREFKETFYAKQNLNHEILLALRYLRTLGINYYRAHGRGYPDESLIKDIDPQSARAVEEVVKRTLHPEELAGPLQQEQFIKWMNGTIQKAYRSYTNPTATHELFKHFKVDQLVAMHHPMLEPINQYLFAKYREPGEIDSHLAEYHTDAAKFYVDPITEFPDHTLYHGTSSDRNFRSILLQGILPSVDGSAGPGLYGVRKDDLSFAEEWGGSRYRVVRFKVKDNAKIVDIAQGEGKRVFEAAKLPIDEFADYFGADIVGYPYTVHAYVVKNSAVLEKPEGLYRQVMTFPAFLEKAKKAGDSPNELRKVLQSLIINGFSAQEIEIFSDGVPALKKVPGLWDFVHEFYQDPNVNGVIRDYGTQIYLGMLDLIDLRKAHDPTSRKTAMETEKELNQTLDTLGGFGRLEELKIPEIMTRISRHLVDRNDPEGNEIVRQFFWDRFMRYESRIKLGKGIRYGIGPVLANAGILAWYHYAGLSPDQLKAMLEYMDPVMSGILPFMFYANPWPDFKDRGRQRRFSEILLNEFERSASLAPKSHCILRFLGQKILQKVR